MLIRKCNRVAHALGLFQVVVLIGLEKNHGARYGGVSGVHIAEHLGPGGLHKLVVAVDIQLRALFFALVAVENAQRNAYAEADVLINGRIAAHVEAEGRIGRSIGDSQPVVCLALSTDCKRRSQVRPRIERGLADVVERRICAEKSNGPVTSNCSTGVRSFKSARS